MNITDIKNIVEIVVDAARLGLGFWQALRGTKEKTFSF
jgi:hypothetical protein